MVKTRKRSVVRRKMMGGNIMDTIYSIELSDVINAAKNSVYVAGLTTIAYGAYLGIDKLIKWYRKVDKYLQRVLIEMNSLMKMIVSLSIEKFSNLEIINNIIDKFDGIDASLKYVVKNYDKIQNDFNKEKIPDNMININLISYSEILRISKNIDELYKFFKDFRNILIIPGVDMVIIRDKYLEGLKRATHIYKLVNIILLSNTRVLDILEKAETMNNRLTIKRK